MCHIILSKKTLCSGLNKMFSHLAYKITEDHQLNMLYGQTKKNQDEENAKPSRKNLESLYNLMKK